MNLNILTYLIFFSVISFITVKVGWVFYKNGEHFIHNLMPNDPHLVQSINKLMLVGYYLLNLGYSAVILSLWENITTIEQMIRVLSEKTGIIIIGLGLMHFWNLFWLNLIPKIKNNKAIKTSKTNI